MRRYFFPIIVGICVITGLIIVDVSQHFSLGTSLTAQERRLSQEQLKAAGHDPGSVDGVWGPQTEAAVRDFQKQHGLAVSGALDDDTHNALGLITARQSQPAPRPGVMPDAVQEAQTPRTVPEERPEQRKSAHDRSNIFQASQGLPASQALPTQPDQGVAYPALADNVLGPLPSRLRRLTQPIMSPPHRFSTPRLSRLACI